MTSPGREMKNFTELNELSIRRHQLVEKKKFQRIFQELMSRPEFGHTEDESSNQHKAGGAEKLKEEKEQSVEKEVNFASCQVMPPVPDVFNIEPPSFTAPPVILDVEKLPPWPCRTQCPECQQFILTETTSSANGITWMMCFVTAMLGCVAGCCLIPFCLNKFKSTTHKCPRCRTTIVTVRRL